MYVLTLEVAFAEFPCSWGETCTLMDTPYIPPLLCCKVMLLLIGNKKRGNFHMVLYCILCTCFDIACVHVSIIRASFPVVRVGWRSLSYQDLSVDCNTWSSMRNPYFRKRLVP